MTSVQGRHPDDERLLRFADGELPTDAAEELRSHLEACWQCRAELEGIQGVVNESVRYRNTVLRAHFPPPPDGWMDIRKRLHDLDTSADRALPSMWLRNALNFRIWSAKRLIAGVAALVLVIAIVHQLRFTPSARAAELLKKAVVADEARPQQPRRIEVRLRSRQWKRTILPRARRDASGMSPQGAVPTDSSGIDPTQMLFAKANYSWDDPLSARSFAAWRKQLRDWRDEIRSVNDLGSQAKACYEIHTSTTASSLVEATLTLRQDDLRPVAGSFRFRDQELVEISELADTVHVPSSAAETPAAEYQKPPEPMLKRAERPPSALPQPPTAGDELRVLAVLHRLGADLGEPVEVGRTVQRIIVTATGIEPQRRAQIEGALASLPHVGFRFDEPPSRDFGSSRQPPATLFSSPGTQRTQNELEKQLGGQPALDQLAGLILTSTDALVARAHALRRLAERFPPEAETQLNFDEKGMLSELRADHAVALFERGREILRTVEPLLSTIGPLPQEAGIDRPLASWQSATQQLFTSAKTVERLAVQLFGGVTRTPPGDDLVVHFLLEAKRLDLLARDYAEAAKKEARR